MINAMAAPTKKSVLFINGILEKQVAEEFSDIQDILHDSDLSLLAPLFDACYERIRKNVKAAKGLSVIYFAGHADSHGVQIRHRKPQQKELDNNSARLNAELIREALRRNRKNTVDLVLFNCCESLEIARRISTLGVAKATIGWGTTTNNRACKLFATEFFRHLKSDITDGEMAINSAFNSAEAHIPKSYGLKIFFRSQNEPSFDVTVELCIKTLEKQRNLAKDLAKFLKLPSDATAREIATKLLDDRRSRTSAIAKLAGFLADISKRNPLIDHDYIEALRIIRDLAYTKSLPDQDLATVSESLSDSIATTILDRGRKVVLPAKMRLDQIRNILQRAHAELKSRDEAVSDFSFYYNHSIDGDDSSYLFEDKLILLDCTECPSHFKDLRKREAYVLGVLKNDYPNSNRHLKQFFEKKYELNDLFAELIQHRKNTVAILIPEDQREIWNSFLDKHKEIISVIRPVLDQKVYSLLHEANQKAHSLLQKLRADVKSR
ncbi:MAG: hypothetical protein NTV29_12270 [Planctomycetota bacterium]|nr:hypothetical protein [Planctomycetota bacterium]